jgi:hypothetical protein
VSKKSIFAYEYGWKFLLMMSKTSHDDYGTIYWTKNTFGTSIRQKRLRSIIFLIRFQNLRSHKRKRIKAYPDAHTLFFVLETKKTVVRIFYDKMLVILQ